MSEGNLWKAKAKTAFDIAYQVEHTMLDWKVLFVPLTYVEEEIARLDKIIAKMINEQSSKALELLEEYKKANERLNEMITATCSPKFCCTYAYADELKDALACSILALEREKEENKRNASGWKHCEDCLEAWAKTARTAEAKIAKANQLLDGLNMNLVSVEVKVTLEQLRETLK